MKKMYVNGFMFDEQGKNMVFIEERKFPENVDWSLNPFNGVGGKIESGETHVEAMVREFGEETGVQTRTSDWTLFAIMENPEWIVFYFKCFNELYFWDADTTTEELIYKLPASAEYFTVKHLSFLIPLALYPSLEGVAHIREVSDVTEVPTDSLRALLAEETNEQPLTK